MSIVSLLREIFSNRPSKWYTSQLFKKVAYWRHGKVYPESFELPELIEFSTGFWKPIIRVYKQTLQDGHERALSAYFVDGDLVLTPVIRGTTKNVNIRSQIQVKYQYKKHDYFTRMIIVNGKLYSKKDVYKAKVPKQIKIVYLFNIHTHPRHNNGSRFYYSFFSAQDIKSFIASQAIMTGLVTDKFYLLFRTKSSITTVTHLSDFGISKMSLTQKYGFVLYEGPFKSKLTKLRLDNQG